VRFGGNSACLEIRTDSGELLIIDAGTGIRELGVSMLAETPVSGNILLTHTHWDHISGFPFFAPAFISRNRFDVWSARNFDRQLEEVMAGQMEYTYFPVTLSDMPAALTYHELLEETVQIGSATIHTHYLNHTSVCIGFRIEADGQSIAYASDHEPYEMALLGPDPSPELIGRGLRDGVHHPGDQRLIDWIDGADLLIQDCQYTPEEYPRRIGWGHGSLDYVVDVALLSRAKRLALFHHDPGHDDDFMDRMETAARRRAAESGTALQVFCAAEGVEVRL
jgi:phosphoribosyl 1,2-cyclic phosphodiesterase